MYNTIARNNRLSRGGRALRRGFAARPGDGMANPGSGQLRDDNQYLYEYESRVKGRFDQIETVLKEVVAMQQQRDFVSSAQALAGERLGFGLPVQALENSWVRPLNVGRLYSWCVFETFKHMANEFYTTRPLVMEDEEEFQQFMRDCGLHAVDVSPCADGRLAHVISYVLRLPYRVVRRKSFAGAMFDVEDSLQKWVETEMIRTRGDSSGNGEGSNYLKIAVYHFSSVSPHSEGCAAHGSDEELAALAARDRLYDFRTSVQNSFCGNAGIELLLIGVDTDTDAIRLHMPDCQGAVHIGSYMDCMGLYIEESGQAAAAPAEYWERRVQDWFFDQDRLPPSSGMIRFVSRLIAGNLRQIDYVKRYHQGGYADIGHQERFIGMGVGFEEVQLRNLTFFSYLQTVEEGAQDLDVGVRILSGINVSRGLPVPVIIRSDYHGQVPGAKDRAIERCRQLDRALRDRYRDLVNQDLMHTMLMVRDCGSDDTVEQISDSILATAKEAH